LRGQHAAREDHKAQDGGRVTGRSHLRMYLPWWQSAHEQRPAFPPVDRARAAR